MWCRSERRLKGREVRGESEGGENYDEVEKLDKERENESEEEGGENDGGEVKLGRERGSVTVKK